MTFYEKIRKVVDREGLTNVLYAVSARMDYPLNGFPRCGVDKFMMEISRDVPPGAMLLDAGAGHRPYRNLFHHADYQSCDCMPVLEATGGDTETSHTFYCDLEKIPKDDNIYDVVICNQVLEHVRHPGKVVRELVRILKPGGKLFLTAPQCAGIHMEPFHYFNFTKYGLQLLFEEAGLRVETIKPLGGVFWVLGKAGQKSYEAFLAKVPMPWKPVYFPLHILCRICISSFSFFLYHLDKLDREKRWTLNYGCSCIKPEER